MLLEYGPEILAIVRGTLLYFFRRIHLPFTQAKYVHRQWGRLPHPARFSNAT